MILWHPSGPYAESLVSEHFAILGFDMGLEQQLGEVCPRKGGKESDKAWSGLWEEGDGLRAENKMHIVALIASRKSGRGHQCSRAWPQNCTRGAYEYGRRSARARQKIDVTIRVPVRESYMICRPDATAS